jgi:dTDP-4-amino-4,6-dideoxygalactose transaminase
LKERGVQAVFHYLPLHLSPMGEKYGGKPGDCPVTERITDRLLRLPFYTNMTGDEQKTVIAALREFSV